MIVLDVSPVTVRGPLGPRERHTGFARLIATDEALYVARGRNRGGTVDTVRAYPLPEGSPTQRGRAGSWGDWAWSSCGCSSRWGDHTADQLIAQVNEV